MGLILYFFFQLSFANELEQGDILYKKREHLANVYTALKHYESFRKANPNSVAALWRISMAHYYIGHKLKRSSKRENHFRKGIAVGEQCAQLSKRKSVECIFWLGTNTALLNKEHGILSLAFGIGKMIDLFEESKKLDPHYASSGPYRMLALLYYKAPSFLGGDKKKAFKYIEYATKNSPNEPLNLYFQLKFLIDEGEKDKAMEKAKKFIKRSKPNEYEFYESHSAHRKIESFIKLKKMP